MSKVAHFKYDTELELLTAFEQGFVNEEEYREEVELNEIVDSLLNGYSRVVMA